MSMTCFCHQLIALTPNSLKPHLKCLKYKCKNCGKDKLKSKKKYKNHYNKCLETLVKCKKCMLKCLVKSRRLTLQPASHWRGIAQSAVSPGVVESELPRHIRMFVRKLKSIVVGVPRTLNANACKSIYRNVKRLSLTASAVVAKLSEEHLQGREGERRRGN